jgi:hypothetical protein
VFLHADPLALALALDSFSLREARLALFLRTGWSYRL